MRLSNSTRTRRDRPWVLLALVWMLGMALVQPAPAQDEAQDAAKPAGAEAQAGAEPKAAAPAGETPRRRESMLVWFIRAAGPIGFVLFAMSLYLTALVIRLALEFRVSEAVPAHLVDRLEEAIKERKFQEAYDVCREDSSFLARLVRTGVANLPNGRAEAKESMDVLSEEIIVTMESRASYLATIGTLGPMIGLLGTVWGMILAFQNIALSGGQPRPEKLADNIGTALITTLLGIILAVPAIFFFAFFRNRIAMVAMEATKVADRTIAAFWTAAKQPQTAATKA